MYWSLLKGSTGVPMLIGMMTLNQPVACTKIITLFDGAVRRLSDVCYDMRNERIAAFPRTGFGNGFTAKTDVREFMHALLRKHELVMLGPYSHAPEQFLSVDDAL